MGLIAAVVGWGRGASPDVTAAALAAALEAEQGRAAHVELASGALLGCVAFGAGPGAFRDLVAVDESAGAAALVDGRLDNRAELRSRLAAPEDATAAALVLRAYLAWGDDFPARLEGDFAGAIWSWREQRLLAFRDPLGVKPLYWGPRPGGVAVASDVAALLPLAGAARVADDHLIVEHLTWEYQSVDRTFWADLHRLPGGHVAVAGPEATTVRRYWFPPANEVRPSSTAAAHEQARALLVESVRRRLVSAQPVLAHLSGGIDSSSIVCVADQLVRQGAAGVPRLEVVSARYPGLACDEGPYIEAVTRAIALPARSWDGRSDEFPDLDAPSLAGPAMRSHRADGSGGEFAIAREIGAGTILSGTGGDQLGGPFGVGEEEVRRRFLWVGWRTLARSDLSAAQRASRAAFLLRLLAPRFARRLVAGYRARRDAPDWLLPRWRHLAGDLASGRHAPPPRPLSSLVGEAHWRELTSARIARALDLDQRCAAAHGVEVRYPFLDERLVSFVLALPFEHWPSPTPYARLHRDFLAGLLPAEVRGRTTKTVFSPIVAYRLRRMESRLRALFFGGEWASARWVDRSAAQRMLERALSSDDEAWSSWHPVRAVATLEAWLRVV